MDRIKTWLIEVAIKKMGPSAIRAGLAAAVAFVMAHSGMLEQFGVVYDKASNTLMLHLDGLQKWMDVTGLGILAAGFMAAQHHTEAAITGQPHSGDPALETRRATDPLQGGSDAK